jgi:hypothetical protein
VRVYKWLNDEKKSNVASHSDELKQERNLQVKYLCLSSEILNLTYSGKKKVLPSICPKTNQIISSPTF